MTEDNPRIKAARQLLAEAEKRLDHHRQEMQTLIREAANMIRATHRPYELEIENTVNQFRKELAETIDRETKENPDPLEGVAMGKTKRYLNRTGRLVREELIKGVYETVTTASKFPIGLTHSRPSLGDKIIRILKADGTPSLRFESRYDLRDWKPLKDMQP